MTPHPLPDAALDGDIAILGRKGGGKTYTAKGIVERLLDLKRRVLILDPLGVWAGLRTAADGAGAGYPVAIIGGERADLPLDPGAAKAMASVLATENVPAVLDLSDLSKTAQQTFLLGFLHELRRVNRDPLTIVLEEADVFAPQNPMGDDSKALHAEIDWIARRGRYRGFRLVTITQRPARLSKDVLTQCATLIAHRLPAPQDRDAVKAWVDGNGDRDAAKAVFDTLATLQVGEAWVWASEQGTLKRERFPTIKTLDTSATPKAGEKRIEPKALADVDLSAVRAALAASAPKPEAAKKAQAAALDPKAIEEAERRGYERGFAEGDKGAFARMHEAWAKALRAMSAEIAASIERMQATQAVQERAVVVSRPMHRAAVAPKAPPRQASVAQPKPTGELPAALQRVVDAIGWWKAAGQSPVARARACVVAGYSPKASTFGVYIADLVKRGFVETPGPGLVALTEPGVKCADIPDFATAEDIHVKALSLLKPQEQRVFDVVYRAWPDAIRRHAVAEALGLSPTASTTGVYIAAVAAYGLIAPSSAGEVRAADWLFPGGHR